jgi:hypothetical protein
MLARVRQTDRPTDRLSDRLRARHRVGELAKEMNLQPDWETD